MSEITVGFLKSRHQRTDSFSVELWLGADRGGAPLQPFSDRYRSGELVTYRSLVNEPLAHHAEADPIQTRETAISGESLIHRSTRQVLDDQLDASLQIYDHIHPESEPFDLDALDRFKSLTDPEAILDGVELSTLTKLLIKQGMTIEGNGAATGSY